MYLIIKRFEFNFDKKQWNHYIFPSMRKFQTVKIKQIIPQRVVEYSFNFQTNPIQEKKKIWKPHTEVPSREFINKSSRKLRQNDIDAITISVSTFSHSPVEGTTIERF